MKKRIYVIESEKGFLRDVEEYTDNVYKAVTFVDYDNAVKCLRSVKTLLSAECNVTTSNIDFPRQQSHS